MEKIIIITIVLLAFIFLIRCLIKAFNEDSTSVSCCGKCDDPSGCTCKNDQNKTKEYFIRAMALLGAIRR